MIAGLVGGHVRPELIDRGVQRGRGKAGGGETLGARRLVKALKPQLTEMGLVSTALLVENLIINKETL